MIIAEIGINHLGNLNTLKKYIKFINKTKIEGVTIQLLKKNFFKDDFKHFYINRGTLLKTLIKLSKKKIGIVTDSVDDLIIKNLKNIDFFKLLGSQVNNTNILQKLYKLKKPVFLSNRGLDEFNEKKLIELVKRNKNQYIIHTQLKTHKKFANLENLKRLKKKLNNKVCFGSHCNTPKIIIDSIRYKPKKIFFYIKDNFKKNYPDNSYAIPLNKIEKLIKKIK